MRAFRSRLAAFVTGAATCLIPLSWNIAVAADAKPAPASASILPVPGVGCERLAQIKSPDAEISSTQSFDAGADIPKSDLMPMFGPMPIVAKGLPAFCRIVGHIRPETGSDIGFEVWLPTKGWDGRLTGVGIGGFAGSIDYLSLGLALKAGQAGVATDTGHNGSAQESSWAKGHFERVRDYGWRAVHLSTVLAKALGATFYGRGPSKSYFIGCSGGGRQGLMEASRFPEDYDGVVAGAPAASWTDLAFAMINPVQAQIPAGAAIRAQQTALLQQEVLRQCDAVDGQRDGLIADPRKCRFDAAPLACGVSTSPQCFSAPQIAALQRIYGGPRTKAGQRVAWGYLPGGAESGTPFPNLGWQGYILASPQGRPGGEMLVGGLLANLVPHPFATPATFDYAHDPALLRAALSADLDVAPNLRKFFDRGGKLVIWHGWADAAIPPQATLSFYDAVVRASGRTTKQSVRLFMVPGVQHCMGGTGPDSFGQLNAPIPGDSAERNLAAALEQWTEGTRPAPDMLVARRGHGGLMGMAEHGPERQRLLCAWPKTATLLPNGDPDRADAYVCR